MIVVTYGFVILFAHKHSEVVQFRDLLWLVMAIIGDRVLTRLLRKKR